MLCMSRGPSTSSRQPAHCISALNTRRYMALITMATTAQCIQCLVTSSSSVGWEKQVASLLPFSTQRNGARCQEEEDCSCSLSVSSGLILTHTHTHWSHVMSVMKGCVYSKACLFQRDSLSWPSRLWIHSIINWVWCLHLLINKSTLNEFIHSLIIKWIHS